MKEDVAMQPMLDLWLPFLLLLPRNANDHKALLFQYLRPMSVWFIISFLSMYVQSNRGMLCVVSLFVANDPRYLSLWQRWAILFSIDGDLVYVERVNGTIDPKIQ